MIDNELPKFLVFINRGNPETSRVLKISSQWPSVIIEKELILTAAWQHGTVNWVNHLMKHLSVFEKQGFLHVPSFYNPELCRLALNELVSFSGSFSTDFSPLSHSDFEMVDNQKKLKYCQSIFESNLQIRKFISLSLYNLSARLLNVKDVYFSGIELHIRNSGGGEIPIHQDNVSFSLTKSKALTAYIVLVDQSKETGGLGYYNYTVGSPMLPHSITSIPGFSSSIDVNSLLEEEPSFPILSVGDVIFHHCQTPHFARPRPRGLVDAYALSARFFSLDDSVDNSKYQQYLKRLSQHRGD